MKRHTIEQLLGKNKYLVDDEHAHILINKEICNHCADKPCTTSCPAGLYTLKGGELSFDYAGCLECGTCRVVCPNKGAIQWDFPRGGFGIHFRYG
ncbi:MAG: ferredoxin family protein [Firmicutes bacterium]|nr:ferredoxin family protein [Bacillota bacterium]